MRSGGGGQLAGAVACLGVLSGARPPRRAQEAQACSEVAGTSVVSHHGPQQSRHSQIHLHGEYAALYDLSNQTPLRVGTPRRPRKWRKFDGDHKVEMG